MSLAPERTRTDDEDWQVADATDRGLADHGTCHLFFKSHQESHNSFDGDCASFEQVFCCY
jgi:hypothetical protein